MKNTTNHVLLKAASLLICLGFAVRCHSQVCTGSLGDPVVSVNFGSGINPGNPLAAATTTYSFTSSICPNDGSYTVVSSSSGCFGSTWHTLSEDHTPNDVDGYMMLINASFTPGDFYTDTVRNLCGNTKYEFSAWVTNVLLSTAPCPNHIRPSLTFNIETTTGTILGTYSTGDIGESGIPTWLQYGLFFTTPLNNNAVVIRITNNAPGGCGNDLALDDIIFRPCGPTVTVSVPGINQTDINVCLNNVSPVPIFATIGSGYSSPFKQWQISLDSGSTWSDIPGETSDNFLFNGTTAGVYKYRLTVAEAINIASVNCRVASNIITIAIRDIPSVNATNNGPVCENTSLNLTAGGGVTYHWTGPAGFNSTLANPSLIALSNLSGIYNVTVTDQYGCINQASTTVEIIPKPVVSISNDQTVCEGIQVSLNAGGGNTYLWYPATGLSAVNIPNPIASAVDTTTYFAIVSNGICSDTSSVTINIVKKPVAMAGTDKILLKGQSAVLDGIAGGSDISFYWSPDTFLDSAILIRPVTRATRDIKYTLHVSSNAGCGVDEDDVFVKVYNDIYVPNAFSPNNDGLNDTWRIDGLVAVPNARVVVFNRYGNIVFETTGNTQQWNGIYKNEALAAGAYVYMIDLKNGRNILKGWVVIVR